MKRSDLALRLTRAVHKAEDAVDTALDDATTLVQEMLQGRKEVGFSALIGAEACEAATAYIGLIGAARSRLLEVHKALTAAAPQIGVTNLDELMGPGQTKPNVTGAAPAGAIGGLEAA
ncbi:hypothetical protein ACETK8_20480 (plasmid) [Brevundimonas staleyi]|uniref:Uncharacterized protein n=1 Tax=Brevundimonas staleyi TaxID=74326 RepID=A0ABW0FQE1_9CAUL